MPLTVFGLFTNGGGNELQCKYSKKAKREYTDTQDLKLLMQVQVKVFSVHVVPYIILLNFFP